MFYNFLLFLMYLRAKTYVHTRQLFNFSEPVEVLQGMWLEGADFRNKPAKPVEVFLSVENIKQMKIERKW